MAAAAAAAAASGTHGPTEYAVSGARDIVSAFLLFITPAIEKIILDTTNREAFRKYGDKWKGMNETDLRAYLGLLILAGVYRSRGEAAASLWDAESGRAIFRATMSLKLFYTYSRVLRFDDRESRAERRATDKLAAIREVWDMWVERLPQLYTPGCDVTVDEQLVSFRGRLHIYLSIYLSISLSIYIFVYVIQVSSRHRLQTRIYPSISPVLRPMSLPPVYAQQAGKIWNQDMGGLRRKVQLEKQKCATFEHTAHSLSDRADRKPAIILDYNRNKGGVDNLDKVIGTYSCRRMTARWPLVIFHNIIDVSSYNAFVICRETNPTWMPCKRNKRRVFLEQLGKALVAPLIKRRECLPRTEASAAIVKAVQKGSTARGGGGGADDDDDGGGGGGGDDGGRNHHEDSSAPGPSAPRAGASKRKQCQFCPPKKDGKTHNVCCRCKKYICKGCAQPCCHTCAHWGDGE